MNYALCTADLGDGRSVTITAGDIARKIMVIPESERVTNLLTRFQTE